MKITAGFSKKVNEGNITLISSNCVAGCIYSDLGKEFISPTVNLYFYADCFLKFCENLEYYLNIDLVESVTSKYKSEINYPLGSLDGIEVHFLHYNSFQEAKEKWNSRKERIDFNNIRFIMTDRDGFNEELAIRFSNLPGNKNILLSAKEYNISENVLCYDEDEEISDDFTTFRKYEKYFDVVRWFNEK